MSVLNVSSIPEPQRRPDQPETGCRDHRDESSPGPLSKPQKILNVHGLARRVVDAPEAHARPWMAVELAHGFISLFEQLETAQRDSLRKQAALTQLLRHYERGLKQIAEGSWAVGLPEYVDDPQKFAGDLLSQKVR